MASIGSVVSEGEMMALRRKGGEKFMRPELKEHPTPLSVSRYPQSVMGGGIYNCTFVFRTDMVFNLGGELGAPWLEGWWPEMTILE